ncbi:MAG: 3-hydroxybutyrate dehydrogenase [Proteobacteria bacterium]|nr:3-hydroxybutyrate dehydrogenase [Pseudomonadota bacterium]
MGLKGKTALITGSTGGIGEAFARAFAAEGCNIVLNGFGEAADIENLRKDIAKSGTEVVYDAADVGKPADVEKMINAALKRFGAVDILINNAVTRHYAPVEAFPVDKWDLALAVNLSAAFHTIRLALPEMKKRNWGRIINMASIHATKLVKDRIDYMTTKAAIVGMTRAVALECSTTGVTCNAIAPGWVLTPHAERQIARQMAEHKQTREDALKTLVDVRQPSRRPIMPAEVAALGVFLCGDGAANITGASVPIDGAWATS